MLRVWILLFFFVCVLQPLSAEAKAKGEDCSCPTVSCGPCQKKISVGKEVRFCSWGEINVCRKVICENVNYYFGCISSLKNGKKDEEGKASLSDVREDEDFTLPYEQKKKLAAKKQKKRRAKKVSKRGSSKKESLARELPPKIVGQKRGVSSLRIREPEVSQNRAPTADEILRRSQKDEAVNLNPAGRVEASNESRVLVGEEFSEVIVGKVTSTQGSLRRVHHGELQPLKKGADLYIGDEILNQGSRSRKITLLFPKGEIKLVVGPKSRLIVHDPHSLVGRFQPFVHLVYGSLEADIQMDEGSFDVLSGKVVTRASKGKMKTHYEMVEGELRVKVESLKGKLVVIKAEDLASPGTEVQAGHFISWASESAFLSPIFAMSEQRRKKLGLITVKKTMAALKDWPANRSPASSEESLCRKPVGQFQQCAWSCEGNPKGAKGCQAQKAAVHCVRRTCNAAGQWGQATPFASAYRDLCPAKGTRVGDCQP